MIPTYLSESPLRHLFAFVEMEEKNYFKAPERKKQRVMLPYAWNQEDKCDLLSLHNSNLSVHYIGPGRTDTDAASVRGNHSIPPQCGIYYFEVTVENKGKDGYIGIGFCGPDVPLHRLPGWDPLSWGYHGDDGNKFQCQGKGKQYGPTFSTNDTVGCGINFMDRTAFYTRNGLYLGEAFSDLPVELSVPIYPCVGLRTQGEIIRANFGASPFLFDIDFHVRNQRECAMKKIQELPLPEIDLKNTISAYLAHHGYSKTLSVFEQQNSFTKSKMELRIQLKNLILNGNLEEAISLLNLECPRIYHERPDILTELHIQAFLEYIKSSQPIKALEYGQKYLSRLSSHPVVPNAFSLLAYADKSRAPESKLLCNSRRQIIADLVNSSVLVSIGMPGVPVFETLVRQMLVAGQESASLSCGKTSILNFYDLTKI